MINSKFLSVLEEFPGIRFEDLKNEYSLDDIKLYLERENMIYNYNNSFVIFKDQIVIKKMFGQEIIDCLVIAHKEHIKDYIKYVIISRLENGIPTVRYYTYGQSALARQKKISNERKSSICGNLVNAFSSFDEDAYISELNYYENIEKILKGLI